jgi:hypothetical protein
MSVLAELPREFHLASAATAASACVVDLDPMVSLLKNLSGLGIGLPMKIATDDF